MRSCTFSIFKALFLVLVLSIFVLVPNQLFAQNSFTVLYGFATYVNAILSISDNSLIVGGDNGHIFKTIDQGVTWNIVYSNTNLPIHCFAYKASNSYIFAGYGNNTNPGGILRSTNNGDSWTSLGGEIASKTVYALIVASDGSIIAGCRNRSSNTGTIFRSTDNGSSWMNVYSCLDIECFSLAKSSIGNIYAAFGGAPGVTMTSTVMLSTDNGINWSNIGPDLSYRIGFVAVSQADTVYYLCNSRFYKKGPNQNWVRMTDVLGGYSFEEDLSVNRMNHIYTTSNAGLFTSINGGDSWTCIISNNCYSAELDSQGYLWVGCETQIYRSTEPTIPPGIPTPSLPFNGATQQSLTPVLSWQQLTVTSLYQVQVSTNSGMTNPMVDDTTSTVSYTIHPNILSTNTIYYWQVRGHNINGWGNWSVVKHFKTYYPYIPDTLILTVEIGRAHLSWTPPDTIRVDAIGYNVYRRLGLNGTFSRLNTELLSPQTVMYCDTLHTPGNYGYGVKAVYPPGVESGISNIVSADIQVQISAVTASPAGGVYNQGQVIILTCPTEDAGIYYTTDGTEPTESPGQHYTVPISVTTNTELKAKAFKQNWLPSITLAENYTILNPPFQFTAVQTQDAVNLSWLVPRITSRALLGYNLYRRFGNTGEFTHLNPSTLLVPTQYQDTDIIAGTYYYYLTAVYNEGTSDQSETISVTTILTVSTPTFTPSPGTYGVTQYVRLNTTTEQDTIHYTRDGSNPTQSSPVYNVPIIVSESDTIKARSFRNGWQPSETVTGIYIIDPTGINDNPAPPINTSLISVYPNPFNHAINIRYSVAKTDRIRLSVYNIRGQLEKQLECANRKAGNYAVSWDGITKDNNLAPNGMYLVKMETSVGIFTHKIIHVK